MHCNRDFGYFTMTTSQRRYSIFNLLSFVTYVLATEKNDEKSEIHNSYSPLLAALYEDYYHFPDRVTTSKDKKQEYYSFRNEKGRYFCPIDEDTKNYRELMKDAQLQYCLVKKNFKKSEKQTCTKETKPLLVDNEDFDKPLRTCGPQSLRRLYSFSYEICIEKSAMKEVLKKIIRKDDGDVIASAQIVPVYDICYSHSSNDVFFTKHKPRSPQLFENSRLDEEKSMNDHFEKYSTETYGLKNLENLQKTLNAFNLQNPDPEYRKYQLQMLVPPEDFALEHWKKTTFHMINYAPQHKSKVAIWNAINSYVHSKSIQLYSNFEIVEIYTGTVGKLKDDNNNLVYLGNDRRAAVTIPLIWWKMLFTSHENNGTHKAVVIIMNNVDGIDRICQEEEGACNFTNWKIQLDENFSKNVYCCSIATARDRILAINYVNTDYLVFIPTLQLK